MPEVEAVKIEELYEDITMFKHRKEPDAKMTSKTSK